MAKSTARAARPAPAAAPEPSADYPTTKYRRVPISDRNPHGYEARQCASDEDETNFDPKVWKDSPDDLTDAEDAAPAPKARGKKGKADKGEAAESDGSGADE